MRQKQADAGILTFHATHPKWSFAKVEESTGLVTEVAEKRPISNIATVGIYYYKHGRDFVNGAEQMIAKNIRVNNEFYVCPVFNELIGDGKKVYNYPVAEMCGLGTPEDLNKFLSGR
jgi:dTDP-glucose pyrophosphorylase